MVYALSWPICDIIRIANDLSTLGVLLSLNRGLEVYSDYCSLRIQFALREITYVSILTTNRHFNRHDLALDPHHIAGPEHNLCLTTLSS